MGRWDCLGQNSADDDACPLFDEGIAARRLDDLEVLHSVEQRKGPNGCPVAPEFIRVNDVWHVIVHQKPSEKGLCGLGVSPILHKEIKDRAAVPQ